MLIKYASIEIAMTCLQSFGQVSELIHSTEKALLQVTNDILLASDNVFVSVLVLLDVIVNHNILLERLTCCRYQRNCTNLV